MNHFNLLPPEIIEFIFKNVNLDDLINLRIVDKRFKQICDQIKIRQLFLCEKSTKYHPLFWFYTNHPTYFNKGNSIEFSKFQNYATIFQFDKHLKRLALDIDDFNFSILNQFKLLEQLYVTTNKLNDNYKLSLDHLKIFDFEFDKYHHYEDKSDFKLTLDTIKLFAFNLLNVFSDNEFVFQINYPDKILFFEIDFNVNWQLLYNNFLKDFNNLQHLKLSVWNGSDQIDEDILSRFKNLKILYLSFYYFHEDYDNLIKNIKFLINDKENLRRSDLEIYFHGVKLINQNQLNQFKFSSDPTEFDYNLLEFQIKNYDLLKDNCDNYRINYCDLIKLIKIVPSTFTNKFPFIHEVKANDHIDNEDKFIEFLNNLTNLSELKLTNCELTKSFYDQLINMGYLNALRYLTIEEKKDLEINFNFILRLKQLKRFETNQIITNHIDLIYKLYKGNGFMHRFIFKCDFKNYIKIDRYSWYDIVSYYLDDNLEEVNNFKIYCLYYLNDVITKLKELKFEKL